MEINQWLDLAEEYLHIDYMTMELRSILLLKEELPMNEELKFYVAGVQFHELDSIIDDLEEGDTLELTPEPTNKFDSNAVRLEWEGTMIGYVPKKHSSAVSAMLEISDGIVCEIILLSPSKKPWERIKVLITDDEETGDA